MKNKKIKVRALEGNLLDVLKYIYVFKHEHDYSPSIREMCAAIKTPAGVDLSTSVCRYNLGCLQKMGYIDFLPRESRTVHLTPLGKAFMQAHSLPGRIQEKKIELRKATADIDALLLEVDELVPA